MYGLQGGALCIEWNEMWCEATSSSEKTRQGMRVSRLEILETEDACPEGMVGFVSDGVMHLAEPDGLILLENCGPS